VRKHKGEEILKNCYNINLDSIADEDYFEVVRGDAWQGTKFDPELIKMFEESMKEAGIEKPGNIVNPVGGCDSTPFHKAGVRTVTFAAQDPVMTNYYHTFYDTPDRFSVETVGTGLDVVLRVIDKIAAVEDGKRADKESAETTEATAE
jgi:Zn-dependent M28 family amino/carboxypeptidase